MPPSSAHTLLFTAVAACAMAGSAHATLLKTYITGDLATGAPTIYEVIFDPALADSAVPVPIVFDPRGLPLDGIDFLPGTGNTKVVVGSPTHKIAAYNVVTGLAEPDIVFDTNLIAVPPAAPAGTHPSTVLATPSHVYYTENQFGFGTTPSHRIIRKPLGGGPEEVVFSGGGPLENFEGIEMVGSRLYFFSTDPGDATKRALMSIGLVAGVHDGAAPVKEIGGLAAAPAGDGSDELDFDPVSGKIYGTNIVNGEVVVVDPFAPPGTSGAIFISGAAVAAGAPDALKLLLREVDGIRSDGLGHLIFVGRGGIMGAIDIAGVVADGADNGDVIRLYDSAPGVEGTGYVFDDLTPFAAVPVPASLGLVAAGLAALGLVRRRRAPRFPSRLLRAHSQARRFQPAPRGN